MGAALPLRPPGPSVLAPQRGPLLLLTLSLGLACAQKTLEEVPVQPGFDAQKVRVLAPGAAPAVAVSRAPPPLRVQHNRGRRLDQTREELKGAGRREAAGRGPGDTEGSLTGNDKEQAACPVHPPARPAGP